MVSTLGWPDQAMRRSASFPTSNMVLCAPKHGGVSWAWEDTRLLQRLDRATSDLEEGNLAAGDCVTEFLFKQRMIYLGAPTGYYYSNLNGCFCRQY